MLHQLIHPRLKILLKSQLHKIQKILQVSQKHLQLTDTTTATTTALTTETFIPAPFDVCVEILPSKSRVVSANINGRDLLINFLCKNKVTVNVCWNYCVHSTKTPKNSSGDAVCYRWHFSLQENRIYIGPKDIIIDGGQASICFSNQIGVIKANNCRTYSGIWGVNERFSLQVYRTERTVYDSIR